MARSIGGGLDLNLFSQDRLLKEKSIVGWRNTVESRKALSASRDPFMSMAQTSRVGWSLVF
jgi:hypothetical protein